MDCRRSDCWHGRQGKATVSVNFKSHVEIKSHFQIASITLKVEDY